MRGQRSLFDNLLQPVSVRPLRLSKGRNGGYVARRNTALLLRYYYHAHLCRRTFADALSCLEAEFYLSQSRIVDIMSERHEELSGVVADRPDVRALREFLPQYEFSASVPEQGTSMWKRLPGRATRTYPHP